MRRAVFGWAVLTLLAAQAPAQDAAPAAAEQAAPAAAEVYGPVDNRPKEKCPQPAPGGEIVVCAEAEDPARFRVQSSGELDPTGKGAQGPPRAPDLFNLPQPAMVGVGVTMQGCFIPPCPAPMPKLIDLKAIPEAPPGSDAARVGQGLAPRGRDDAPAPAKPPGSASPAGVR